MSTPKPLAPGTPPAPAGRSRWDSIDSFSESVLDGLLGAAYIALGIAGALVEVGGMAREAAWDAWLQDRPRRLQVRTARRRRWRKAKDWRRWAVRLEMVAVAGFWVTKMALKLTRPYVRDEIRERAALGYRNARQLNGPGPRARAIRFAAAQPGPSTQQSGPQPQSAQAAQTGSTGGQRTGRRQRRTWFFSGWFPGEAAAQPQTGPVNDAGADQGSQGSGDVKITVTVSSVDQSDDEASVVEAGAAGEAGAPQSGDETLQSTAGLEAGSAGGSGEDVIDAEVVPDSDLGQPRSRRWDREPETAEDKRFFDLRQAGYRGPINQDSYPCGDDSREVLATEWVITRTVEPTWDWREFIAQQQDIQQGIPSDSGAVQAPAAVSAETAVTVSTTSPSTTSTSLEGTTMTSNTTEISTSAFGLGGELQNVSDLRREGQIVQQLVEQFNALGAIIVGFGTSLPERYQAAPFGTAKLTEAVNGIAENRNRAGDMGEYLGLLDSACAAAQGLGEHISAQRAEGDTSGFAQR